MSKSYRRYEILLPRWFNDRKVVPDELIGETLLDLRNQFGAMSSETQIIRGQWEYSGQLYNDELVRMVVDVPDTSESREFFQQFKERLKVRFEQIDIWMTTHLIEVV